MPAKRKRTTQPHPEIAAQLVAHVIALGGSVRSRAEHLGVSPMVLNRYERAERVPDIDTLDQIARKLGFRLVLALR